MRRRSSRLLAIAPAARWRFVAIVVLLLGISATYVFQGIVIARALGRIFEGRGVAEILPLVGLVLALQLVRVGLLVWRESMALTTQGLVKEAVRQRLTAKLFTLGPRWLQRTRTGSLQSTLVDGVETLDPLVGRFLPQAAATVVGAAAVTGYLITLDPLVGLIVLGCAALAPVLPLVSGRLTDSRMAAWFAGYRRLYAEILDAIQGMATLKAFNASRHRGEQLDRQAEQFARESIRLNALVIAYVAVVALVVGVGSAVAVGVGAVRLTAGELSAVELLTILILARECFRPLHDLERAYHASYRSGPACDDIFELLDAEPDVADGPVAVVPGEPPALRFEDVTFAYRSGGRPALDGLALDVGAGERVALVGRSGAGKTTVVSLLLRFFDPSSGRILLDGHDLRTLRLDDLRSLVAVVSQETYLFHGTVADNLRLARPDATDIELVAAAEAAHAHEFVTELPHGYDTVVGERGLRLSGGQRQRIAIARALLKDAPVLVLDEATSSVDAAGEAAIQAALNQLTSGRTTLVIAHRLSTVRHADRVAVLDQGRVVEIGDHDSLLATRGAYSRLVAAQGSPA